LLLGLTLVATLVVASVGTARATDLEPGWVVRVVSFERVESERPLEYHDIQTGRRLTAAYRVVVEVHPGYFLQATGTTTFPSFFVDQAALGGVGFDVVHSTVTGYLHQLPDPGMLWHTTSREFPPVADPVAAFSAFRARGLEPVRIDTETLLSTPRRIVGVRAATVSEGPASAPHERGCEVVLKVKNFSEAVFWEPAPLSFVPQAPTMEVGSLASATVTYSAKDQTITGSFTECPETGAGVRLRYTVGALEAPDSFVLEGSP